MVTTMFLYMAGEILNFFVQMEIIVGADKFLIYTVPARNILSVLTAYIYIYTHTYIYIYIHTYIYIYTHRVHEPEGLTFFRPCSYPGHNMRIVESVRMAGAATKEVSGLYSPK